MSRKLVAYFSASGSTAELAKALADAIGADLYKITPEVPYTKADLDWTDKQARSSIEMNDPAFRPALADNSANIGAYDVVLVGFPIWWYVAPTIVNTFLERYDFSGKIMVPFATSGGSGLGEAVKKLQPSVSDRVKWLEGKVFSGKPSKDALANWVENLNL